MAFPVPSKAAELKALRSALRANGVHYYTIAPARKGLPDLVALTDRPSAVWLRRSELAGTLTAHQQNQISQAAAAGWRTIIAFGCHEALRALLARPPCRRAAG